MGERRVWMFAALGIALILTGCSATTDRGLPANLPAAVRIAPGTVVASSAGNGEWHVWVRAADVIDGYKTARRLLVNAGFHTTYDNVYSTSGEGQFCSAKYCVSVNAYNDPIHGKSIGYEIYRNSGLGVPKN